MSAITPDEFLQRIACVEPHRAGELRAPHKPLLLLLALGRVATGKERLARYDAEIDPRLSWLLRKFGHARTKPENTHHPFGRLRRDGLWEIPEDATLSVTGSDDLLKTELRGRNVRGGFPESHYNLLRRDPETVERAAAYLLARFFPVTLHLAIRDAVDLPAGMVLQSVPGYLIRRLRRRDPKFRRAVLEAYQQRCAVCDLDMEIDQDFFGLEAAHIHWHCFEGPDEVSNGLALCRVHHAALDWGAIGLSPSGGHQLKLLVSQRLKGTSQAFQQLVASSGQPLRPPQERSQLPDATFVKWHSENVFRGEPLTPQPESRQPDLMRSDSIPTASGGCRR